MMQPARAPRGDKDRERLLRIDPARASLFHGTLSDLPSLLRAGDLVVMNDAATLPASLRGWLNDGEALEVRLLQKIRREENGEFWTAVLFGRGDSRTRTEERGAPPRVAPGDRIHFDEGLVAVVAPPPWQVSTTSDASRLVALDFDATSDRFWRAIYAHGKPIQYAHASCALQLWDVQTLYASRPWCVELPSAGRPLSAATLLGLAKRGVGWATLTHAAGLSSTGDLRLDAQLPLPESFDIPAPTLAAIADTHARGGRVVAVGTTVVRALEGAADSARGLVAGVGTTDLRIAPPFRPRVVDGVLSGMHEPGSSHFSLLEIFASNESLMRAHEEAEARGYLAHEFGDSVLLLAS